MPKKNLKKNKAEEGDEKEEEEEELEEEEKEEGTEEGTEEGGEGEGEKKLNAILDKKINKIVQAIKETPKRSKIITGKADAEISVMEADPFLKKTRPFVQLSGKMEGFINDVKILARGGIPESLTKALQESDDTAGGFLVPEEFQAEVIRFSTEAAIVRPRARIIPMTRNTKTLPKLDQSNYKFAGIDIHWEGDEGDTKEESQPKFGRITLKLGKMIGLCPVSDDLLADSAVNLANFLVSIFGESIAYEEDKQFLRGNGMKKPLGIINCGTSAPRATADKIQYEDLKDMMAALPAWADAGAVWITTKAGLHQIMDIKSGIYTGAAVDQTEGFPLFLPGFNIAGGVPTTIFGYPMLLTDKLPPVGVKGDIILGNLSAYYIGDRGGLAVASSIHDRFRQDETVFRFVKRVDGQCALSTAFVVLDDAS